MEKSKKTDQDVKHAVKSFVEPFLVWVNGRLGPSLLCHQDGLPDWFRRGGHLSQENEWLDLETLDGLMASSLSGFDPRYSLFVTILFDSVLHLDRSRCPRFVPMHNARWHSVCCEFLLDPALHGHVGSAAFFSPLATVKQPIVQVITKHGVKMRCQGRSSTGMAMKRIVTRVLEPQGRSKRRLINANRYQGYVLRSCKAWMLCSLLGNYSHVHSHQSRPTELETRRRLYEVFTQPRFERWVVKLIHQSINVLTACIREFVGHSIQNSPGLSTHVGELMKLPEYVQSTQQSMNELRGYFRRYLVWDTPWHVYGNSHEQSDLYYSFKNLPPSPCSLQRFYVCGRTDCGIPCPHKFMKAKEVKTSAATDMSEEEGLEEDARGVLRALIEEMSSDRAVVVQHRRDEVDREKKDSEDEAKSGWRWSMDGFHESLNLLMERMEAAASSLSYSRPWKLDVLFGTKNLSPKQLTPQEQRAIARVVRVCGPVRCGDPMPRIVSFFSFMGVRPAMVEVLLDLLQQSVRDSTTENMLRFVMSKLDTHEPRASALLRHAWSEVCRAEDHFYLQDLPLPLVRAQLEAVRDVHFGSIPLGSPVCFVFCPSCEMVYSHLTDGSTFCRKMFRYGLKNAALDPMTRHAYCTHKDTTTRKMCDQRLVFLPVVGRVLRWKKKTIAMCCQPGCARFMVLDQGERIYTLWTSRGFACHLCMCEQLYNITKVSQLDSIFSSDAAPQKCLMKWHHEDDKETRRFKHSQLHILAPHVYCCKKCYLPSIGDRAKKELNDDDTEEQKRARLTEIAQEEDDRWTLEREEKRTRARSQRGRRMIRKAAGGC